MLVTLDWDRFLFLQGPYSYEADVANDQLLGSSHHYECTDNNSVDEKIAFRNNGLRKKIDQETAMMSLIT